MSISLVALGRAAGRAQWEVQHDGRTFAVFARDGGLVVTDGLCPHRQGRLAQGIVRDGAVVCPSHWYVFDLDTGACRTTGNYELVRYPVVWRDGEPFAQIPALVTRSWSSILRAHAAQGRTQSQGSSS